MSVVQFAASIFFLRIFIPERFRDDRTLHFLDLLTQLGPPILSIMIEK